MEAVSKPTSARVQRVTVGMCAHNEERRIAAALASVLSQRLTDRFLLSEVLVVASGCTDGTERIVEAIEHQDARVRLIVQAGREGKASALNEILHQARGELVAIANADAMLEQGALEDLLTPFAEGPSPSLACGAPTPNTSAGGIVNLVEDLQWRIHNRTLETQSRLHLPNHCCDEFVAMRRGLIDSLPSDIVNDGAFLGTWASLRGMSVLFRPNAQVRVDVPRNLRGLLTQRHRILRGHRQVREVLGRWPNTLEGLFVKNPAVAARILILEALRTRRSLLTFMLVMLPLEALSGVLATCDRLRSLRYEPAWTMVD